MKSLLYISVAFLANCIANVHAVAHPAQHRLTTEPSHLSLLDLHKALIQHESITGNEHAVANFLISYLQAQNFTVETQTVTNATDSAPPRENILAYIGKTRKTRTLVSSHIDTVPPFWPYERRGDEIWGRGSVDAKGSVVTQIKAVESLVADSTIKEGDVALLFVVGEETGGDGMRKANELGLSWKTAIFGEPTELKLASGHKGNLGFKITAEGIAGHSGYPSLGRNANSMMVKALYELEQASLPWSEKYGNTTVNIGRVDGGVAANVIAEEAVAHIAIRIADGTPEAVKEIVLAAVAKAGQGMKVDFSHGYGPVEIDHDVDGMLAIHHPPTDLACRSADIIQASRRSSSITALTYRT